MRLLCLLALASGLAGCSPRTLEDCITEAAKAPTERGVTVAANACHARFEGARVEAEKKAIAQRAAKIEEKWSGIRQVQYLNAVKQIIGDPDVSFSAPCEALPGKETPPSCTTHQWKDARTSKCTGDSCPIWQLQSTPDGKVWASWNVLPP